MKRMSKMRKLVAPAKKLNKCRPDLPRGKLVLTRRASTRSGKGDHDGTMAVTIDLEIARMA
jgi:hypothetical protein